MLLLSIYSHHFRVSKKNSKFHKAKSVFCFREALDLEPTRVPLKSDAKPRKLVHIVNISISFSFVEREKRGFLTITLFSTVNTKTFCSLCKILVFLLLERSVSSILFERANY